VVLLKKEYSLIIAYAALFSLVFFVLFGTITVLIPNNFFLRMTPITYLDYVFLTLTSILLGIYVSLLVYQKKHMSKACDVTAVGGWFSGFIGFGCPICNKILILLFGVAGVLNYIEPYKPLFGSVGVALMGYAVYMKGKNISVI
jgi:hypothetical protein